MAEAAQRRVQVAEVLLEFERARHWHSAIADLVDAEIAEP